MQKLLAVDEGLASFFYVRSGHVYELIYDERGQSPPSWGASTDLCASGNYTVSMDSDKAVWLYYTKSSDPNVYVRKKTFGGSWSSSAVIYQTSGTLVEVISANFVDDNIPVCFIAETVNNVKRIYAISDSNHSSYWSGETPLVLKSPPAKEKLDARIHWQNQVSIDFPGLSYPEEFPGHLSMDSEGYLYCPRSAVCNTIVRHKDELDPSNAHTWGVFWDHFIHPGGCAVDNVRGKVYIPDGLLSGGSGGGNIGGWGRIQAFDIAKRTENLGYNPGFGTLPPQCNQAYSPQYVGGAVWPGDVAVDEAHGLLYVTASIEGKIDVYDVENTVNYTGQNNRWPRSNLESGISVSDLPYVQNIINALISEPNDPDVYLIEYASDPNCVYWDPNS